MAFKKVTHVIFDCDGVLLDSMPLYKSCIESILKPHGKKLGADFVSKVAGRLDFEIVDLVISENNLPITREEVMKQMRVYLFDAYPLVSLMPGVKRLVDHLHKHNIPMAVATSSTKIGMDLKIQNHQETFAKFHHIVLGSSDPEVKTGKPDPQIFLVCASRFSEKPKPENCLVFEDALNGVEAALAGGMQAVIIPVEDMELKHSAKATLAVSSLEEFKPELFGLPPFTN